MSTNTGARSERAVRISRNMLVAALVAAFLVGFATSAIADMRLPSTPIGTPPVISTYRVVATPVPPPTPRPAPVRHRTHPPVSRQPASGSCYAEPGTPPASVLHRESRGNPTARNPSGAAGCWQFMPGTWGGYKGYASADQAPVSVQNERAKQVWANGAGCSHWRATANC